MLWNKGKEKENQRPRYVSNGTIWMIPTADIQPNPDQPRRDFSYEKLLELAQSIGENGLLHPLTVTFRDGVPILIAGERRLRAAKIAGMREIPCVEREADGVQQALLALIENLQRQDMNCFETAEGIRRLIEVYGLTQEEAAERCGVSPRHYLDMEAGRVNPKLSTVIHIASESNISLDVLKSEVRGTHAVSLPPE